jgi:D-tyrosyl-tRNA(Tyr) deacylase
MIALLQRVTSARVRVGDRITGEIGAGLLALVCAVRNDSEREADALLAKMLACRIFSDDAGRMNRSVRDVNGGLLLVSQFTLAADTSSGTRPSFSRAAPPDAGRRLFDYLVAQARRAHAPVECGEFGAMMQVELINDGPVTVWLQVEPQAGAGAS